MKVLAKLGLVTAAAATVLFIFIYEFQGPVINRVMSQAPSETTTAPQNQELQNQPVEPIVEVEQPIQEPDNSEELQELPEEVIEEPERAEPKPVEETEQPETTGSTRHIYGKITLSTSGEQLEGVNVMVPGSTVAKVSNPSGGYTIEVPVNTRELVYIYRGKKLVRSINLANNPVNVVLNLDAMQYD